MEKLILRVLVTFTIGLLVVGAILGFVTVADCGSVFSPHGGCGEVLAGQRALTIAFIGLGLTSMAAAIVADLPARSTPVPTADDEDLASSDVEG